MRRLALVALVVVLAVACSGAARPTGPAPADPRARIVKYAPLGMKADAKVPTQAVILGTDATGGSTVITLVPHDTAVPLWSGAYVATTVLGKDLTDFTFTAPTDDLNASAMTTVKFLAAMTGASIDAKRTVGGIVFPDGSIGTADVPDIYAAYEHVTGKILPRPVPVDDDEMAIDDAVAKALDDRYDAWQQKVAQKWARLLELEAAGRLPAPLVQVARVARELATDAEKLHGQGLSSAAYSRITAAWVYVASATATADTVDDCRAGNLDGARARLADLAAQLTPTASASTTIAAVQPDSIAAHLRVIAAFQATATGAQLAAVATDRVAAANTLLDQTAKLPSASLQSDQVAVDVVTAILPAVLAIHRSATANAVALESLDVDTGFDVRYQAGAPAIKALADSFTSAATANAGSADHPVTERTAAGPLESFAASELAWFSTSIAIAWSSLGVERDPITGIPTKIGHDKQLAHVLTSAERIARENARAAKIATGSIPIPARIAYQAARALRDGDAADRVSALESFWRASLYAQTAVMLARN